jgi:hypothetical protein
MKNIALLFSKTSAVQNSLFNIRYSKDKTGSIPQGEIWDSPLETSSTM